MEPARPISGTTTQRRSVGLSDAGGIVAIALVDTTVVAGTSTGDIVVWDVDTNTIKATLKGHTEKIVDLAIDPAGSERAVSASYDGTARVWNLKTLECVHTLTGHESWLRSVDVREGLVLTAGGDNTARVWNLQSGVHENTLLGHTDWVRSVHAHRHEPNVIVTASWDATVRTWNPSTGACRKSITCDSAVRCICDNSKKLEVVVGCVSGAVSILDLSVGTVLAQLLPPQENPTNAVCTHHSRILAATSAGDVHVWTCDGPALGVFKQHPAFVNAVAAAPDGTCVSVDGEGHAFAWEVATRRVVLEDAADSPALCCAATGNDETTCLACGLESGTIVALRLASRDVDSDTESGQGQAPIAGVFGDWFHKKGGWKKTMGLQLTGRKRRFCVLEGPAVKYYEALDEQQLPRNLKGTIHLTTDTSLEVKDHRLLIHNPDRTWDLEASTTEQTNRWCQRLTRVINELQSGGTSATAGEAAGEAAGDTDPAQQDGDEAPQPLSANDALVNGGENRREVEETKTDGEAGEQRQPIGDEGGVDASVI